MSKNEAPIFKEEPIAENVEEDEYKLFGIITSHDIISIILIVGLFIMRYLGESTFVDNSLLLIIGYYFGRRT